MARRKKSSGSGVLQIAFIIESVFIYKMSLKNCSLAPAML